jgi:copper(I)-binding protein
MMTRGTLPSSRDAGPAARANRRPALLLGALVGALTLGSLGAAAHAAEQGLVISDPWMRSVVPSRPAAGYFILSNDTSKPHTLVGAASPACGMLMLHESVHQGGEDRMMMVQSVLVPAHRKIKFAPGDYHLMCTSPSQAVRPGQSVPVTLRFADGGTVAASFPVRGANGK